MGVGAAETERAYPYATGGVARGPLLGLCRNLNRKVFPGDVGVGLAHVQGLGDALVLQGEGGLHHPADARGAFGVPDVGFEGAHHHGVGLVSALAVHRGQSLHLDGISQGSSGAVTLDVVDAGRGEVCHLQGSADHILLGGAVGGGEAVAAAVLIDGAAADKGEDLIAVALRIGEALEQHHATAFGADVTVGIAGEGVAFSPGGHGAQAAEVDIGVGGEQRVDAAGKREVALPCPQALTGEVQADQ